MHWCADMSLLTSYRISPACLVYKASLPQATAQAEGAIPVMNSGLDENVNSKRLHILKILDEFPWDDAKIHVAQQSGSTRPIDVFTRSFEEWQNSWNGSWHSNRCWNKKYIFSIIELPNRLDKWLFGGGFKVISQKPIHKDGKKWIDYKVDLEPIYEEFIGRLIIEWKKDARAKGRIPSTIVPDMYVSELLEERYAGEKFPGYSNINHSYSSLEHMWSVAKQDWISALKHCQGVYLITDRKTGLRYVGSAYGEEGIWSRWATYFASGGHANNKLLKRLLSQPGKGQKYASENFQFTLLEQASSRDSEQHIIERESYWKEVLMTRSEFGLNEN